MAIDDPAEKIKEHYLTDKKSAADKVVKEIMKAGLVAASLSPDPVVGGSAKVIKVIIDRFASRSSRETLESLVIQILELYENLKGEVDSFIERSVSEERVQHLISVSFEEAFWGANERKVTRFAAVVAGTVANANEAQQFEDAASYIRALDELSEDDLRVLKLFYHYQKDLVTENHAMPHAIFFDTNRMTTLQDGIRTLGMQIDDVDSRCSRLAGYGLLLPLERPQHYGDINYHYFRMTLSGKRLIILLIDVAKESPEFRAVRS